jgi:hypothetical protein
VPAGVSATSGSIQTVSWSAVNGADRYNIYREGFFLGTSSSSSFVDRYPLPGCTYAVAAWSRTRGEGWLSSYTTSGAGTATVAACAAANTSYASITLHNRTVFFNLPTNERYQLSLFDVHGNIIKSLASGQGSTGMQHASLGSCITNRNVHLLRLQTGKTLVTRKVNLLSCEGL